VAVSLAVALAPAGARAQDGAGDEQYTDPFAGQPQARPKPKTKPTPVQPVPHQQLPSQQATPQPTAPAAQQPAAAPRELPRTGFDVVPLALVGVALVLAGLALRRRAAHGRD
jgi:LPXTG-motif cell wall-anchored protein